MARFIIHIGDGKCGSTAIQSALYLSRNALAEKAILFDTVTPKSGHTVVPLLFGMKSRVTDPARLTLARKVIDLVRSKAAQHDWIVLSAENLINLDPAELPNLLACITDKADEVHVIAYVREPSAMYLSSVQQILKGSHDYVLPEAYARRVDRKIAQWQDFVGPGNFTLRLFDRKSLLDGNVVTDFASYLSGVTGQAVTLTSQSSNPSMSAEQMQVMQMYRSQLFKDAAGTVTDRSALLARFFTELNDVRYIGHRPRLTSFAKLAVAHGNRVVVDALNSRFPSLSMPDVAAGSPPPQPPYPWHQGSSILTILDQSDDTFVKGLCALLPDMNGGKAIKGPELEEMLTSVSGCGPNEVGALCDVHANYLRHLRKCKPLG